MNDEAREVWRRGFVPQLSIAQLLALRKGLADDDGRLLQGATTSPPPMHRVKDWPCDAACPIGYAVWQAAGVLTVWQVEEAFAELCFAADREMGKAADCRHFLEWADDTPREQMRAELILEVDLALAARQVFQSGVTP